MNDAAQSPQKETVYAPKISTMIVVTAFIVGVMFLVHTKIYGKSYNPTPEPIEAPKQIQKDQPGFVVTQKQEFLYFGGSGRFSHCSISAFKDLKTGTEYLVLQGDQGISFHSRHR